jgi:HEPN domain-containing protein
VVARLLRELPSSVEVDEEMVEQGRVLDSFYIPPRYPSGHPEGAPFEHYGSLQSGEAVEYARSIIEFVRTHLA